MLIVRLPLMIAEAALRTGLSAAGAVVRLVTGSGEDEEVRVTAPETVRHPAGRERPGPAVAQEPEGGVATMPGPPPPTAEEALARSRAREAAAVPPPPSRPPAPPRHAPAEGAHVDREAEVVESFGPAEEPGAALQVDEPWDGYDGMPASAVVQRLSGADEATKAVVRLYEQRHKARRTVLAATGG